MDQLSIPEVPFVIELKTRSLMNLSIAAIVVAFVIVLIIRKVK
ncbi:MAG: hypothetical protein AAF206_24500 [Bacteroidota bacterium]